MKTPMNFQLSAPARRYLRLLAIAALLLLPAILLSSYGSASGGEAHSEAAHGAEHGGVPSIVWLQFANFGLYAIILFVLLRPRVSGYFKDREAAYGSALKRAEAAKAEAEARRKEIQDRLNLLESTKEDSIRKAREEAAAMKLQIVEEAKALSIKLQADAARTAEVELDRAKAALREDLLLQSVQMAKKILADRIQEQDQKRLQTEFVDKIQVVSR